MVKEDKEYPLKRRHNCPTVYKRKTREEWRIEWKEAVKESERLLELYKLRLKKKHLYNSTQVKEIAKSRRRKTKKKLKMIEKEIHAEKRDIKRGKLPKKVKKEKYKYTGIDKKIENELLRLNEGAELYIYLWRAMYLKPVQIQYRLETDFKVKYNCNQILDIISNEKGEKYIEYLRGKIEDKLIQVPIASQQMRLARLEDIFNQSMTPVVTKYVLNDKGEIIDRLTNIDKKTALNALTLARQELEDNKVMTRNNVVINNSKVLNIDTANMSDDDLVKAFKQNISYALNYQSVK